MARIHLSPPAVTAAEREALLAAFDSGWVAPAGPDLAAFESAFAARLGLPAAVALSSGTAALHLALHTAGVGPGDVVLVPTLTFAATANAVRYVGATPVFVDSEWSTWNVDPALLAEAVAAEQAAGRRVGAIVTVDVFGQGADHEPIRALCGHHGIPLVEDAAEAVGATWQGRPVGTFGDVAAFSFNGNKLLTTGGGGMLVAHDPAVVERVRHLATQAREPVRHYEHTEVGYNYRLSNLLAAVGRAQLDRLDEMLAARAAIRRRYIEALGDLPGVGFNPVDERGVPNHWLTIVVLGDEAATDPTGLIDALEAVDAEARPTWKPMHRQPVWAGNRIVGGAVADEVFARGVCLPSGAGLTADEQARVIDAARRALGR